MGNVVDYVRREFRGFGELAFSNVDSLVLSELSYMRLLGLVPVFGEAKSVATVPIRELLRAESYDGMFVSNSSEMNDYRLSLLRAVCESPRFRGLRVGEYAERLDESEQQQFAAMTFDLGADFGLYVAFRGTDGTLVGWKEDFNMAVRCPVIGGHSKGGNMAVYAAMQITQSDLEATNERAQRLGLLPALGGSVPGRNCRISRIFSHDGPGMPQVMVHSRAYQAIAARIDKTVPESSIIGMLLQSQIKPTFVKADAISILQHMGSSWQVTQSGEFERASELTGGAQLISKTIDGWFDRVSQGQRERAINQIYDIFAAAGYGNIADLVANWTNSLPKIVAAARGTDVETRELIKDVLKAIPASAAKVAVGELRNDKEGDA